MWRRSEEPSARALSLPLNCSDQPPPCSSYPVPSSSLLDAFKLLLSEQTSPSAPPQQSTNRIAQSATRGPATVGNGGAQGVKEQVQVQVQEQPRRGGVEQVQGRARAGAGNPGRALHAVRGRQGPPLRRAARDAGAHRAPRIAAGAPAPPPRLPLPRRRPRRGGPAVVRAHDDGLHPDQLRHPGAPRVAHPDPGPGHQELQGRRVRVRVRRHEGRGGRRVAGRGPARRRRAPPPPRRAGGARDGALQVPQGLPHLLRVRRPRRRRARVRARRRAPRRRRGRRPPQGLPRPHRHARAAGTEEHRRRRRRRAGGRRALTACDEL
jgi:hypothetical protein|uniref:Uncharacterized protein n=1 Tax=Zea mays TaxID=4577 RepID=C0PP21_MAIZE|nr:unknown [Zea mays]